MSCSAELFQAFFNTAQDAIFIIDAATRTVSEANVQAVKDTGYPLGELKGCCADTLFRLPDGSPFSFFTENDSRPAECRSQDLRVLRKNGETLPVGVDASCFSWNQTSYVFVAARKSEDVSYGAVPRPATTWEREDFPTIIGHSTKIRDVCRLIGSLAKTDATVLIQGETGTGKEIVANAVHAHSRRYRGPLVKVNCAALTETLLESELFGHVKGAFTGAIQDRRGRFKQADGGTILLDEVGSMSPAGQAKLLRVLQEREFEPVGSSVTTSVDVRVIAATNTNLARAVAEGKFREDLYYRLNVFLISLPPLRERKEDIALLAEHFLHNYNRSVGKSIRAFAPETLSSLVKHEWPGNVRELGNAIEHGVIVENGPVLSPESLPANLGELREPGNRAPVSTEPTLRDKLNLLEKQILIEALVRANWIKKQAAATLGIDARNLPYLLRKHSVDENAAARPACGN